MKGLSFLLFTGLSILAWGTFGPIVYQSQVVVGDGETLPCWSPWIGIAASYFMIAAISQVIASGGNLTGKWSWTGMGWAFLAGIFGACGILGILLAFRFGGTPVFVMPLVFGVASVFHALGTMLFVKTIRNATIFFYLGILVVVIGGLGIASFAPDSTDRHAPLALLVCVLVAAFSWGGYGPLLNRCQIAMTGNAGNQLRPLLVVGLTFLAISVTVSLLFRSKLPGSVFSWNIGGAVWSTLAGAVLVIGGLSTIFAFQRLGKSGPVMPLVFGGAPIVNTIVWSMCNPEIESLGVAFQASLFLLIAGAATVLLNVPQVSPKQSQPT